MLHEFWKIFHGCKRFSPFLTTWMEVILPLNSASLGSPAN
jgi:hypothetical protein